MHQQLCPLLVLNEEHAEDTLLNSNELKLVLSKTPKFSPSPNRIKPKTVAGDCYIFGRRLIKIKAHNSFVCKDLIVRVKVNYELTCMVP
jgi:hypothetical protein